MFICADLLTAINQVKDEEWYKNTLFVITADHTNISFDKKYKTSIGIFRVEVARFMYQVH